MKISYDQTFQEPLAEFGLEVVSLFKDGNYAVVADRFGYALAYDRAPADALASDVSSCLTEEGRAVVIAQTGQPRISVKYFEQPNELALFGLVECSMPLEADDGALLVELIVSTEKNNFHLWIEDVSYAV
jgi:hypothetical protein